MTPKEKIAAYDRIVEMVRERREDTKVVKPVGTLNTRQGSKGFKPVEVGETVYQLTDRYILVMETLDGTSSAQVPYYIDTLGPRVDLYKPKEI